MAKIHPLADVQSTKIGDETTVWQFSVILKNAQIGKDCNICSHTFIENDVIIGDRVTVKTGVQIWDGITIEDDVFIGPNVTFTNDLVPRSKLYPETFAKTFIKKGASIGANATIIAGNTIGEYSLVGAGSVVTKDVPPFSVFYGNPAKLKGYVTKEGLLLDLRLKAENGNQYIFDKEQLKLK
jgi:acetyltransferase-like isoleucine patch superfamily enzyme